MREENLARIVANAGKLPKPRRSRRFDRVEDLDRCARLRVDREVPPRSKDAAD